jgi:fibronectin type 3 domain-containing protein
MTRSKVWSSVAEAICCVLVLPYFMGVSFGGDFPPQKYAVELSATIQESPPKITLTWPGDDDSEGYQVSKRTLDSDWQAIANLPNSATSFEDGSVQAGKVYEYRFVKTWAANDETYFGYGYIRSGIKAPLVDQHGIVLLVVESNLAGAIGGELDQLTSDLIGDGWGVRRLTVSMNDSPPAVRNVIKNAYSSDPSNVKAVFLIGHIPVPYSGNINPDGHENHQGAWPADLYYADMDGTWTDSTLTATTAERDVNWNVPGDGKFDQDQPPATLKLQVGRVDLSNMTCYSNKAQSRSELDLMRQYFAKDHAFRFRVFTADRRGILCDNFADKGKDPIAGSAWRSYPTFFGPGKSDEAPWDGYFPAVTANSYLWSFASGGGSYYWSMGVGTSDDFATNDIKAVFTMWMGSYFGDWNNESNFMRAPLGSGYALTSTYTGFPSTWYFPMGLGETIGACVLQSQNNNTNGIYAPWEQGSHQVHICLHGDPTLRMFPVIPPSNPNATTQSGRVDLSWNASSDQNIIGYHVYRALSLDGSFTRVTGNAPVNSTTYSDLAPAGSYIYMIKAIKLEQTGSGTFYNPSQGIFASATVTGTSSQPPAIPTGLQANVISSSQIDLLWDDVAGRKGFKVERKTGGNGAWSEVATVQSASYSSTGLIPSTDYYFRVRAFNDVGTSGYSGEAHATTSASQSSQASAQFIGTDTITGGTWTSKYGKDGAMIPAGGQTIPGYARLDIQGATEFVWMPDTTDGRAPLVDSTGSDRVASAWYGDQITINLVISASSAQQVAIYFLDWDLEGRVEHLDILDGSSGAKLDSRDLSNFQNGKYLLYKINGSVQLNITKSAGPNTLLSGILFGGPVAGPISNKAVTIMVTRSANQLTLNFRGDSGQQFALQASADFHSWTTVGNGVVGIGGAKITVPINAKTPFTCYRAVNTP